MKIQTKFQSEITISESDIIHFPKGLLGFEDHHDFVILNIEGNDYFKTLQNIHVKDLAFIIINPWDFYSDYDIHIPDKDLRTIGIDPSEENIMSIYSIITLKDSLKTSTCNLLAPIIINEETKKGKQFVLNDSPYSTRHQLIPTEGVV